MKRTAAGGAVRGMALYEEEVTKLNIKDIKGSLNGKAQAYELLKPHHTSARYSVYLHNCECYLTCIQQFYKQEMHID